MLRSSLRVMIVAVIFMAASEAGILCDGRRGEAEQENQEHQPGQLPPAGSERLGVDYRRVAATEIKQDDPEKPPSPEHDSEQHQHAEKDPGEQPVARAGD